MPHDLETLRRWLTVVLWITAICLTSLPVLYSFTGWRKSLLGRAFMLLTVSFATAVDMTILFQYWRPKDILTIFWVQGTIFTALSASGLILSILVVKMNWLKRKGDLDEQ